MVQFTLLLALGLLVAVVVLFALVSKLQGELHGLRRQVADLRKWADQLYTWVRTEARPTTAVVEPRRVAPAEPAPAPRPVAPKVPAAPEPVAARPEEPAPPARPKVPVTPEIWVPRAEERVVPPRPTVPAAAELVAARPEAPVPPAKPKVPVTPEIHVPRAEELAPPGWRLSSGSPSDRPPMSCATWFAGCARRPSSGTGSWTG